MENKFYELESDRLLLRKVKASDLDDMFEYGSDNKVSEYVTWHTHINKEATKEFIDHVLGKYAKGEVNNWAIVLKDNNKMIGTINFMNDYSKNEWVELGYVMNQNYWNKGIMTESVKLVMAYSFNVLKLNRVIARAISLNTGSYTVMEKVGMTKEGVSREHFKKEGIFFDLVNYSILKSEFYKNKIGIEN